MNEGERERERDGERGQRDVGCVACQSGQSITVPKRALDRLSNQFRTPSSFVAIKREKERQSGISRGKCCLCDGESESSVSVELSRSRKNIVGGRVFRATEKDRK